MQKTGTVGAAMLLLWLIVRFFGSYLPGDAAVFAVQTVAAPAPLLLLIPRFSTITTASDSIGMSASARRSQTKRGAL